MLREQRPALPAGMVSIGSVAGAPSGAAQLALNLARAPRELGRILKPLEHETTVRMDQPQLEALASLVAPNLVQNAVR